MSTCAYWNGSRYHADPAAPRRGHYESWFQRANHPTRPLGFWIRYTIFSPKGRPSDAVGELWAVYFDGENNAVTASKSVVPLAECSFSTAGLEHRIASATLTSDHLEGEASGQGHTLAWSLVYRSAEPPLLLLPRALYGATFPKAKSLVGSPLATFSGTLTVDGTAVPIDDWVGSQNHNWGSKHTDEYAWGQVAGFNDAPDAFLEVATARVRVGPLRTPWMTLMVLRVDGETVRLNTLWQSVRADASYDYFRWRFESSARAARTSGHIEAPRDAFVGLPYGNPPGGEKTCLNTKLASCQLTLHRPGRPPRSLQTRNRAAFEILTDKHDHHVALLPIGSGA